MVAEKVIIKNYHGHGKDTEIFVGDINLTSLLRIRDVEISLQVNELISMRLNVLCVDGLDMELEPRLIEIFGTNLPSGLVKYYCIMGPTRFHKIWHVLSGQSRCDYLISQALKHYDMGG